MFRHYALSSYALMYVALTRLKSHHANITCESSLRHHLYIYIHTHTYTYTCTIHTHIHKIYNCLHIHIAILVYVYIRIRTYTHTYTTYTYTYIYIFVCVALGTHYRGGCSRRGVQWMWVVLCSKLVHNTIQITTPCFHCTPL